MKKIINIFTLILLVNGVSNAQLIPHWSFQSKGTAQSKIVDMQIAESNSIIVGTFTDSLLVGSSVLKANSLNDIFLISLNLLGEINWSRQFGGKGDDIPTLLSTNDSTLYLAGLTINNSLLRKNKGHSNKMFIEAITPKGTVIWNFPIPCSTRGAIDVLTIGPGKNILAGGWFEDSITLLGQSYFSQKGARAFSVIISPDGSPISCNVSVGTGNHRLVAASFDRYGNQYWMMALGKRSCINVLNVNFEETKHFTNETILLCKKTQEGNEWIIPIEANDYIEGVSIQCGDNNRIYAGVNFNKQIKVDQFVTETDKQLSPSFVILTPDGNVDTLLRLKGYDYCRMLDFIIGRDENLRMAGYQFGGFMDFENKGQCISSERSTFLGMMDNKGTLVWHHELKEFNNYGRAIAFDQEDNFYVSGAYNKSPTFNLDDKIVVNSSEKGVYVKKYHFCGEKKTGLIELDSMCKGDTLLITALDDFELYYWNDSATTSYRYLATSPGVYTLKAVDAHGCYSIDSIKILQKSNATANIGTDTTLYSGEELKIEIDTLCSQYSWSDNYLGRSRTINWVPFPKQLKLIATVSAENLCKYQDTLNVTFNSHITENNEIFKVYPNPAQNMVYWRFDDGSSEPFTIEISVVNGKVLFLKQYPVVAKANNNTFDLSKLGSGSYVFTARCAGQSKSFNIIKL